MASARIKIGPLWSPLMTPFVLRHAGRSTPAIRCGGDWELASYDHFLWRFASKDRFAKLEGEIRAPREAFVGLKYYNPPGGVKHCLNSKIAGCTLRLTDLATGRTDTLQTADRAAFEILTDDADHGVIINA